MSIKVMIIDGEARLAEPATRSDWCSARPVGETVAVDAATRRALREAWLADALLEHASIASFSRFTLELMALGAPPSLVAASLAAGDDEIRHARACFSLSAASMPFSFCSATRSARSPAGKISARCRQNIR